MNNNELKKDNQNTHQIAFLVTAAAVLQILESLLPNPFPGIRLGLANILTLITLVNFGVRATLEVAILRTIISSFILGSFLSPSFLLSFAGALSSSLVMITIYRFNNMNKKIYLSLRGISIAGAITHNMVQLALVYLLLIKHQAVLAISPWLLISSIIMGWTNGEISIQICRMLDRIKPQKRKNKLNIAIETRLKDDENSPLKIPTLIHKTPVLIKIIAVIVIAITLVISKSANIYGSILVFLLIFATVAKIKPGILLAKLKTISSFLFISFIIPVVFTTEGLIVFNLGILNITQTGILQGSIFAIRLMLLMLSTAILINTTATKELIKGFNQLLIPLRYSGLDTQRIARILTLSWTLVPIFTQQATEYIKKHRIKRKTLRKLTFMIYGIIKMPLEQSEEK